jgi:gamma-glutamyltranspeptidase/glutathione hydrolase
LCFAEAIVNTVDYGMDPQTALDQPRWFWWKGLDTRHEPASTEIVDGLRKRGHDARVWNELDAYGRGQIIWRLPSGTYIAGSDVRGDGQAAGSLRLNGSGNLPGKEGGAPMGDCGNRQHRVHP